MGKRPEGGEARQKPARVRSTPGVPEAPGGLRKLIYVDVGFEFDQGDLDAPVICEVVGWPVPSFPAHQAIASEYLGGGQYRAVTHVPTGCVIREEEL